MWPAEIGQKSPSAALGYFLRAGEAAAAGDGSVSGRQCPRCWGGMAFAEVVAAASHLGGLSGVF